jgi:PDZ domain-containing secreted protein
MATGQFSTVKVFSATLAREREQLGERIAAWLKQHPELTPVDKVITQSSDQEFHCLSVTLFLAAEPGAVAKG